MLRLCLSVDKHSEQTCAPWVWQASTSGRSNLVADMASFHRGRGIAKVVGYGKIDGRRAWWRR